MVDLQGVMDIPGVAVGSLTEFDQSADEFDKEWGRVADAETLFSTGTPGLRSANVMGAPMDIQRMNSAAADAKFDYSVPSGQYQYQMFPPSPSVLHRLSDSDGEKVASSVCRG